MAYSREKKGSSLAEQQIAAWKDKLKTQIPGWESLSSDAQTSLADIAVAFDEETRMAAARNPDKWSVPDDVAIAMRRALSRGYKAAQNGVTPEQLLRAYRKGSMALFEGK